MTETAPKEPGKERESSFWRTFTQSDMRLLLLTFAGTLAANVMTVVVVAFAIIAAHALRPYKDNTPPTPGTMLEMVALGVLWIAMLTGCVIALRQRNRPNTTAGRIFARVTVAATAALTLMTATLLLALLGYAVGVE